ncbi:hypothetical protein FRB99_008278, partial [Tulasnella sp. 403]
MPRRTSTARPAKKELSNKNPSSTDPLPGVAGPSSNPSASPTKAKPPPAAADSIESTLGSWSTLSVPKSIPQSGDSPSAPSAPPPSAGSSQLQQTQTSSRSTSGPSPSPRKKSSKVRGGQARARPPRLSSPHRIPPVPRKLTPEPAPPPPSSSLRISSKQVLSNSSRDRPPRLVSASDRRITTPYPHPKAAATMRASRIPPPILTGPVRQDEGAAVPSETPQMMVAVGKGSGIVRRPSPVPASSSKSEGSTRSSDSYVSLKDDDPDVVAPIAKTAKTTSPTAPVPPVSPTTPPPPALETQPWRSPFSHFFSATLRSPPSSFRHPPHLSPRLNSQIQIPIPIPGIPRIFHPSPLNPTTNTYTDPRSPLANLKPAANRHIIPLPSLTYPSIRQHPRPLPSHPSSPAFVAEQEVEDIAGEEYASDHPQDLVERLMEDDELERVRHWVAHVRTCRQGLVGEEQPEEVVLDEAWEWETPAQIDLEKLVPHQLGASEVDVDPAADITLLALTSPSPFSGLPSPFRLPTTTTPLTPNYPLSGGGTAALTQEPLPPTLPPSTEILSTPAGATPQISSPLPPTVPVIQQILDQGSYFGSAAPSPRPTSPETPPRIVHSSTERHRSKSHHSQHHSLPQAVTPDVPQSTDSDTLSILNRTHGNRSRFTRTNGTRSRAASNSTVSGRGRSPTRRSWKAASERAATRVVTLVERLAVGERAQVIQPIILRGSAAVAAVTGMASGTAARRTPSEGSWSLSSISETDPMERPRTASRSPSVSKYSSSVVPPRPETSQTVLTAELFYRPRPPEPEVENTPAIQPAVPTPEPLKVEENHSTPDTIKALDSQPPAQPLQPPASLPVEKPLPKHPGLPHRESGGTQDSGGKDSGVSCILRRRKCHRAPTSELPGSEEEKDVVVEMEEPVRKVEEKGISTSRDRQPSRSIPPPLARPPPLAVPSVAPPVVPTNGAPPAPAPALVASHSVPRVLPYPASVQRHQPLTPSTTTPSLAFLKLMTLITQFTSDLSTDRRGTPRWKHDFAEAEEKIRMVYETFRMSVERSKPVFKAWLRDENVHREGVIGEEEEGDEEGRTVMYVEDVWEKLAGHGSGRQVPSRVVQEDLIRSIVSSWGLLASECLNSVKDVLEELVTSIVDGHFKCAGDGDQLRMIVRSIAGTQLNLTAESTSNRLSEIAALESSYVFTAGTRQLQNSTDVLARHREVRRQMRESILMNGNPAVESPMAMRSMPIPPAAAPEPMVGSLRPYIQTHHHSQSRESHSMSLSSSNANNRNTSLFSKGPSLSTNATSDFAPQYCPSDVKAPVDGLRRRLATAQHRRTDSR